MSVCSIITLVNVQCAFDETEEALLLLEDMIETQELREKELEHRFQLALYQERRAAELDDLKGRQRFSNPILIPNIVPS
jgi:hypothetical protein